MKCFLDMDGVIVDFVGGMYKLAGLPRHYGPSADHLYAATVGEMGREFWANLKPTPEFTTIIRFVEHNFGMENCCILTSPCPTPGCMDGKRDWLAKYFPYFIQNNRFLMGSCKEFCAEPQAVLIDDHDDNINKFRAAGGLGILVPQPWNSNRGTTLNEVFAGWEMVFQPTK
jgi:5'(3')-deoxyribonucleotidase